ncbi:MAG: type I-U CRISPR-associated protein Csb2 [Betaproteobacteria bacterium]
MLAIALHYLNGWAMAAADGARKEEAEWPPHPDRVFMALACAYFETESGDKQAEWAALEWLEALPPPAVAASPHTQRHQVTCFVPVNDTADPFGKPTEGKPKPAQISGALSIGRRRQPRSFPVAIPYDPVVHLVWPDTEPTVPQRAALDELCRKVTHVGHSASFVAACVVDHAPAPTLLPTALPLGQRLRVPSRGRLAQLAAQCDRDAAIRWADRTAAVARAKKAVKGTKGEEKRARLAIQQAEEAILDREFPDGPPVKALDPRLFRPDPAFTETYGPPTEVAAQAVPHSVFATNLIVLALKGQPAGLRGVLALTAALRNLCMAACPVQPPPEWLSGHRPDGRATAAPHVAFLPLAFVGDRHADGRLLGLALALPRDLDAAEVARCIGPILVDGRGEPHPLPLRDGAGRRLAATLVNAPRPPQKTLWVERWTQPSRYWATVTPVVLDRHFDGSDRWQQAAESVKTGCERIGLPRPRDVLLDPVSRLSGVPHARDFAPLTRKSDGGRMHHVHATLVFDEAVVGPVTIGAGRFRGYGFCRPLPQGGGDG